MPSAFFRRSRPIGVVEIPSWPSLSDKMNPSICSEPRKKQIVANPTGQTGVTAGRVRKPKKQRRNLMCEPHRSVGARRVVRTRYAQPGRVRGRESEVCPMKTLLPQGPVWRGGTSLGVREGHNPAHARGGPEWEESPDRTNRPNSSTPVREGWRGPWAGLRGAPLGRVAQAQFFRVTRKRG